MLTNATTNATTEKPFNPLEPFNSQDQLWVNKLIEHEGMKKSAYQDSRGYWTIGVGFCIDSKLNDGLTTDEIFYILKNRINTARKPLEALPWYNHLDSVRQGACIELVYNMGFAGLMGFHEMIAALDAKNYGKAAGCLRDSKWAEEVGPTRAGDLYYRMFYGQYKK